MYSYERNEELDTYDLETTHTHKIKPNTDLVHRGQCRSSHPQRYGRKLIFRLVTRERLWLGIAHLK